MAAMPTPETIIRKLGLSPHPEGGQFAETFRAPLKVLSAVHEGERTASTAIYFLLQRGQFSAFHRVASDEVWHHYLGDPLELHRIDTGARHECSLLGPDLESGQRPQLVVGAGILQAARPAPGPFGYTLAGCTVAPGFEFADFEMPARAELVERFPDRASLIASLTR